MEINTTQNKQPSLDKRLSDIQQELQVPKNRVNKFGKFNYRSCEDILDAVKPLLQKHNVLLTISDEVVHFPSTVAPQIIETINDNGKVKKEVVFGDRFYIKATATITDLFDESTINSVAYARESLDKSGMDSAQITGATSSYARKYALNGLFLIDDARDPDAHEPTNKSNDSFESPF